jgi:hypothetical protein
MGARQVGQPLFLGLVEPAQSSQGRSGVLPSFGVVGQPVGQVMVGKEGFAGLIERSWDR